MSATVDTPLRILSLDVENILRVIAVRIEPAGRVVELTGKNRNGKSSTIDALWMALGGKEMIPPDPIHDGADVGTVIVDIGDDAGLKYKVTRKLKRKEDGGFAPSLTVASADGAKFEKPQQILDNLIGSLSCDPLAFIAMKSAEQFDLLKRFVPGVDFNGIAAANDADFRKRTDINRDAKARRAQADGIFVDPAAPASRVDEDNLVQKLATAAERNGEVERFRAAQASRNAQANAFDMLAEEDRKRIAELQIEIERLTKSADDHEAKAADLRFEISEAGDPPTAVDTTKLQADISAARAENAKFDAAERAKAEKDRLTREAGALEAQSAELTAQMKRREDAKEKAIAEAKMPVDGITFGDGVILLDGHPLSQASQAQKLSIAISIAVALQPRLRFVTTKNAALLDGDSWNDLVKLADEKDLLIIAETVNSSRAGAVVIEDGMVRAAVKQAAE